MRRAVSTLAAAALATLAFSASAQAEFGLHEFDVTFTQQDASPLTQAGAHPFAMNTHLELNSSSAGLDEQPRDLFFTQIAGLAGDPYAVPTCDAADFLTLISIPKQETVVPDCPDAAAAGEASLRLVNGTGGGELLAAAAVYNLAPVPGTAARLGFWIWGEAPVTIDVTVSDAPPYRLVASTRRISQILEVKEATVSLWGVPGDPVHDPRRGHCLDQGFGTSIGNCPASVGERPFLTLPRSCVGPLSTDWQGVSWENPSVTVSGSAFTHDADGSPLGFTNCGKLGFAPKISAQPTSLAATSPSGLDFSLDTDNEGLANPDGISNTDIEKAVVTLPEGMSANPSLAEGLEVCTMEQLNAETAFSEAGAGCPNASKIGTVEVETPLLEGKLLKGSLFIAKPYENYADNSLLAIYLVIQNRELGISVKQPLKVTPDPVTGQLTTVAEELPQLPFSHFRLHFREGTRSPLVTPQACGKYDVKAVLFPYSGQAPVTTTSTFEIITGPSEGPCPKGGLPPFKPGLIAGTINNRAGSFSPFNLRLFRSDSEQEITHFSIKLPPGITGKLAGIPYCSDAAIAAAKARTGPHGGQEELDDPSCPAASEIGRTLAGAGVGPALTYAPGKVYLAGPYNGSNLSMVAITAGVVGPFDIGTVVIREAFRINPETAEVFIDSVGSDPIPHIIRGIPVHLRDIRAYVDKPEFVLNPTDCSPTSTASTVLGSGLDFVSEADDNPVTVSTRFQAADCAALTFAPQLSLRLIGGTKRGKFPRLVSHLSMNGIGESGIGNAQITLPRSEFIENAHFNTICTRVQFKEGAGNGAGCPAGSIYGHARATTPLLAEPLEGPVMLRSNPERQLPDVVAALHNAQVDFDLVGNVDSVDGALRTTFANAPDAPVTSFDLQLEGGSKGLFVNSRDLCLKKNRAIVHFGGQNGKEYDSRPAMKVKCKGKKGKARHRRHKRHARKAR